MQRKRRTKGLTELTGAAIGMARRARVAAGIYVVLSSCRYRMMMILFEIF
jgi:hypothetical protein